MKPGYSVICTVSYDLYDINIEGERGCYIREYPERGKHLIWFPCNGEYAELREDQFRIKSKRISKDCADLASRIRIL
jgi:hypothetical protein